MTDAYAGLLIILSSQFHTQDFSSGHDYVVAGYADEMEVGIGDYFRVKFPNDWSEDELYDFKWHQIKDEADPFTKFDYMAVE